MEMEVDDALLNSLVDIADFSENNDLGTQRFRHASLDIWGGDQSPSSDLGAFPRFEPMLHKLDHLHMNLVDLGWLSTEIRQSILVPMMYSPWNEFKGSV